MSYNFFLRLALAFMTILATPWMSSEVAMACPPTHSHAQAEWPKHYIPAPASTPIWITLDDLRQHTLGWGRFSLEDELGHAIMVETQRFPNQQSFPFSELVVLTPHTTLDPDLSYTVHMESEDELTLSSSRWNFGVDGMISQEALPPLRIRGTKSHDLSARDPSPCGGITSRMLYELHLEPFQSDYPVRYQLDMEHHDGSVSSSYHGTMRPDEPVALAHVAPGSELPACLTLHVTNLWGDTASLPTWCLPPEPPEREQPVCSTLPTGSHPTRSLLYTLPLLGLLFRRRISPPKESDALARALRRPRI